MHTILNTNRFAGAARLLLAASLLLPCCLYLSSFQSAAAQEVERPNILFAIADDWSLHAGAYGTPWIKTPTFDLRTDTDCVHNLAGQPAHRDQVAKLRGQMEAELKTQGDPRMFGRGHIFDQYKPTRGEGFYEQFMRGEKVDAGWVNETDFEKQPIQ